MGPNSGAFSKNKLCSILLYQLSSLSLKNEKNILNECREKLFLIKMTIDAVFGFGAPMGLLPIFFFCSKYSCTTTSKMLYKFNNLSMTETYNHPSLCLSLKQVKSAVKLTEGNGVHRVRGVGKSYAYGRGVLTVMSITDSMDEENILFLQNHWTDFAQISNIGFFVYWGGLG